MSSVLKTKTKWPEINSMDYLTCKGKGRGDLTHQSSAKEKKAIGWWKKCKYSEKLVLQRILTLLSAWYCLSVLVKLVSVLRWPLNTTPAGLHRYHLPSSALDGWAFGVWGKQEPEPGRAAGGAAVGPWHLHRWLQEVLPPRHHCGEQADSHLP